MIFDLLPIDLVLFLKPTEIDLSLPIIFRLNNAHVDILLYKPASRHCLYTEPSCRMVLLLDCDTDFGGRVASSEYQLRYGNSGCYARRAWALCSWSPRPILNSRINMSS